MRWAILSDIHGNLEAFQEVVRDLERRKVDRILCLGDIVGYGANPNECVALSKRIFQGAVAGNHDHGVLGLLDASYFNEEARVALEWTAQNLTKESQGYLASLPVVAKTEGFTYVHSTPFRPQDWNYIFLGSEAFLNFEAFTTPICFIGHSHAPVVLCKERSGQVHMTLERDVDVDLARQYLMNVGSVGQPRDGNPEAAYGIYDSTVHTFSLIRVPYDITTAQRKVIQAGLPHALAIRLTFGQ